jgi:ATP-dependent protease HslVU (ClpYQ) peptidase subunit
MDSVADLLEKKHYAKLENNKLQIGTFLVGYKGVIYRIENDLQVGISRLNYEAVGCGEDFALGAFHVMAKYKEIKPKERVKRALQAATEFSAAVMPPFHIKVLKNHRKAMIEKIQALTK